jgi:hypothetical protein
MKEGAQRNVEIVHCNCNIPFWVGNGLHTFSGELGESYAMQFEILVTQHNCKYGKVQHNVEIIYCNYKFPLTIINW